MQTQILSLYPTSSCRHPQNVNFLGMQYPKLSDYFMHLRSEYCLKYYKCLDSSGGIVTGYGLDDEELESDSRHEASAFSQSRPDLGPKG
jgi:hypothetical protein